MGDRRQVRRVRLDQDAVERRERRRLAQVARVLERQDAREREVLAEVQVGARLGHAAREAVDDPVAAARSSPRIAGRLGVGVAYVRDHGQVRRARHRDEAPVGRLLLLARRMVVVVVEPGLADAHDPGRPRQRLQRRSSRPPAWRRRRAGARRRSRRRQARPPPARPPRAAAARPLDPTPTHTNASTPAAAPAPAPRRRSALEVLGIQMTMRVNHGLNVLTKPPMPARIGAVRDCGGGKVKSVLPKREDYDKTRRARTQSGPGPAAARPGRRRATR